MPNIAAPGTSVVGKVALSQAPLSPSNPNHPFGLIVHCVKTRLSNGKSMDLKIQKRKL